MSHQPAEQETTPESSINRPGTDVFSGQDREIEAEYHAIFESTIDGLVIMEMDGTIVEANSAACEMFGYAREELIGLNATLLTPPEMLPRFVEAFQSAATVGIIPPDPGSKSRRKDGTLLDVETRGRVFSYRGRPHVLAVVRDITARVRAEEQLQEKEEQYRSIFEAATDGLVIQDSDGLIVEINPAYCRMLGYRRDELIGEHIKILIPPEYHELIDEGMKAIEAGETPTARVTVLKRDGTPLQVEGHGVAILLNGKLHYLGVSRDITDRVQAEEQLRQKEEQYRSIFETTTDGLGVVDMQGTIVEVNPAYCRLTGYSRDELIGLTAVALMHPDDEHQIVDGIKEIEDQGQSARTLTRLVRKDGTLLHIEGHGTPIFFRNAPHILGVVRDITEQVLAEQELRQKEAEYRGIFEATNDALIITDFDGFCVEANPAACRLYGYDYEELIGKNAGEVTHPDYHELARTFVETVRAGGTIVAESVNIRKDGALFPIETRASSLKFRGEPHILAVIRDVTDRVNAQELLERSVEERTHELATLLDVSHTVSSTLELRPLMDLVLDQIARVVEYAGASISLIDGDVSHLVAFRGRGSAEVAVGLRVPVQRMDPSWEGWRTGPFIIDDVRADTPDAIAYRRSEAALLDSSFAYVRSWMAVPLIVNEQMVGVLTLNGDRPGLYTAHHAELVLGIANQAAIAIENARLYARAQDVAVLEERQRLSRELHDSVSQALYGIALGARTAREIAQTDPPGVVGPLDYVLSLAQTAMAEMRGLIFELRPETLEQEGLAAVLQKQADATTARHHIPVTTSLPGEPDAPLQTKEALYRIAQEALHNAVKHAGATEIRLTLEHSGGEIVLAIRDDGKGFDLRKSFPGHLGLHSMRERAERFGGALDIESGVGEGTTITVRVPS